MKKGKKAKEKELVDLSLRDLYTATKKGVNKVATFIADKTSK